MQARHRRINSLERNVLKKGNGYNPLLLQWMNCKPTRSILHEYNLVLDGVAMKSNKPRWGHPGMHS
eukprot:scaffold58909_cov32-Attheya_sp.AAC.2